MTCTHKLGALTCDRPDDHDPDAVGGHTYTTGSYLNDRYGEQGHG